MRTGAATRFPATDRSARNCQNQSDNPPNWEYRICTRWLPVELFPIRVDGIALSVHVPTRTKKLNGYGGWVCCTDR